MPSRERVGKDLRQGPGDCEASMLEIRSSCQYPRLSKCTDILAINTKSNVGDRLSRGVTGQAGGQPSGGVLVGQDVG